MNCQTTQTRLHEFLDGELPAAAASGVSAHLASCEPCRSQLARLRALGDHLRCHGQEAAPVALMERILLAIPIPGADPVLDADANPAATPVPTGRQSLWPRLAAAGLGALLVGSAGMVLQPDLSIPKLTGPLASYLRTADARNINDGLLTDLRRLQKSPEARILSWARNAETQRKERAR